ncbi:MAG: hypothetical protein OSB43_05560 [Nocardioides sp.]|uniref:hypothetical protein n=1 Tax=Nocardioides sp. TaxID=35761 RepID=UPI00238A3298|nr:hypothetical protein [Nocardioides sp.]MDE0775719.1 hypothetical protein [Nocardioides sp.]
MAKHSRRVYGFEPSDVEVLIDGAWQPGVLHAWTQLDDGTWHGTVDYRDADGDRSAAFCAHQIRQNASSHRANTAAADGDSDG